MGSETDGEDGHPLDDYLARAAKRPRTNEAATPGDEQGADDAEDVEQESGSEGEGESDEVDDSEDDGESSDDVDDDDAGNVRDVDNGGKQEPGKADPPSSPDKHSDEADGSGEDTGLVLNAATATDASGKNASAQPARVHIPRKSPAIPNAKPVGVVLVDDTTEIVRDNEVTKLLRNPRYFDDYAEVQTFRCFNCGQVGHHVRDCTNQAREKPCYMCAQFGHDGRDCPNRLCFRCGLPGHKLRDCRVSSAKAVEGRPCGRCGRQDCEAAGKGDYFRYESGCTKSYTASDLRFVRCMSCGECGHLMCKPTPKASSVPSCYNCGRMGHYGEACPSGTRPHLMAERRGDEERAAAELLEYERAIEREYEERRRREQQQQQAQLQQQMQAQQQMQMQRGGGYGGGYGGGGYTVGYQTGGGYQAGGNNTGGAGYRAGDQWRGGGAAVNGYGGGGGFNGGYGGGGGGYGGGYGAGGARNAQVEWGYEPPQARQDDRRGGGGGQRPFSPDVYGRPGGGGGGQRYEDRRSKTPRW